MTEQEIRARIQEIEEEMATLPSGGVSPKTINGKQVYYHQYYVDKQRKYKIVPVEEVELLRKKIERYNVLKQELKELNRLLPKETKPKAKKIEQNVDFECNVTIGEKLTDSTRRVARWERRDAYEKLQDYLYSENNDRVCVVFGLRRTGKSTMLRQAIWDMNETDRSKAAYIKLQSDDTMAKVNRDMKLLSKLGYKYIFIDEVTLAEDFIDTASMFSDVYATMGMKIVLSGTDSLGFWFAESEELYDRIKPNIHTTYIPFGEFSRVLGINDIDEYIRYGGTLRVGELAFDDKDANAEDASFRDDESTRRYIDTAICRNIQHSLKCYDNGSRLDWLRSLYEANELTGAINRVIEDANHRFILSVLTEDFKSHDLGESAKNLRKEKDPTKRTDSLDKVDRETITQKLMDILEIKNKQDRKIEIKESDIDLIKSYLKALELIMDCPTENAQAGLPANEHILFLQPGMRYCQAQALVHVLFKDEYFMSLDEREKTNIQDKILEDVRGRMLEDIVLIDTAKALQGKPYKVFKLQFERGEFDMVVYNTQEHCCDIYEVKHSDKLVIEQAKHLMNEKMIELTERRFGEVKNRYVLYRGETVEHETGVVYKNVAEYLKGLPDTAMTESVGQNIDDDEGHGWGQKM